MADISKITLPSGTTYNIKDQGARDLIAALEGYTYYIGVTTTALTDGATTNPITVGGSSVTAKTGGIVTYSSKEFIFNGTAWQEFGDLSALGALAYKDSASASYTPAGSVSQPTFTGTQGNISVSGTIANTVTLGTETSSATGRANVTPAGTVSQPTFTGTQGSVSVSGTPGGSVATTYNATASGANGNFTPSGSVSAPEITVTPSTESIYSITGVGSAPSWTASVANENLTIGWNAGSVPTRASKTVMTGASASASQPAFTGNKVYAHHTFSGSAMTSTGNFTPEGTVSQPTFTGSAKYVKATVGTASKTMTGTFTPAGTVSQPSFTGTAATITSS